ncbi:MAG: DUF1501 domain-containing protein [Acidobacteriota bacterium]|nr:DUF1501 domain-containing protein [Acidobacteriota bacterium]
MKKVRTIGQVMPSRRELLKFGGLGVLGASIDGVWPLQLRANPAVKTKPRASARNIVFFELAGALSHVDSFDFKENVSTQKDFDVRKTSTGIYLPHALFPRMENVLDKFAQVRSFVSHEEVHLRGQYYVQAGRQLNVAFAPEIPSIGSVVAYELESRRRETDTFPTYVSFNLSTNQIGALSTGYLPPRFSVFDLNPDEALKGMTLDQKASELLEERWRLLSGLREIERDRMASFGRTTSGFEDFSVTAKKLLTDPRWPETFKITEDERKRYGNTSVGLSAVLTRNLLKQDGGTHYVHICHNGWDHHKSIWDRTAKTNHYTLIAEMDPALASLIEDLGTTPSAATPGKTLLDETLVVCMAEFGRTPGPLNFMAGRDHHKHCFPAMFAGAGVKGGTVLGASDSQGWKCVETGWTHKVQPRIENVVATMYSALGIDWSKEVHNTPSGRTYTYVDPLGANGYIPTDELSGIYG